jgi:hypothetical protein
MCRTGTRRIPAERPTEETGIGGEEASSSTLRRPGSAVGPDQCPGSGGGYGQGRPVEGWDKTYRLLHVQAPHLWAAASMTAVIPAKSAV